MIAKISSGVSTAGLIRYLFDTKKAIDHAAPHLVASWDGFAPDPGRAEDFAATKKLLVADLDLHVKQAGRLDRAPEKHVWHCSIRAAESDRHLADEEWADIARRVVAATGIAPAGDPDGCRWVAVRHATDHIHIAATKVRADLRTARYWNDYLTADRELAAIEKEYGLFAVVRGDRTAAKRPTRAEQEKARRTGHASTARETLRTTVRIAVAASTSTEEFFRLLEQTNGILVDVKHFPSGDVRGYTVALQGDTNGQKEPIWYSGSALSPDLSLPKIRKRLEATTDPQPGGPAVRRRANPWHQATAAVERTPHRLDDSDEAAAQAHLAAFGEALDTLPLLAPQALRPHLRQAAEAFERATRSRIQAEYQHARALRGAVRAMVREPAPSNGAVLAMFLDAAVLVVIAAARWHQLRHHDQQVAAAHQSLIHLQAAYDQAAAAPLAALAQHRPPQHNVDRHIRHIRQAVSDHAAQVLQDPAFDALAATLAAAEEAGHDPHQLLQQAADQRALDDARHPARVLTWRIQRLSAWPAPSAHARVAQARSTAQRPNEPVQTATVAPPPQQQQQQQQQQMVRRR
ncbi:relaxase/mobilization nuclease domain-containing protein [Streptomyces sp. NBC_01306]|uniref:relaxase/mobilization nuclease domain-containing protein n=1 Tax=Streptomyces sp. NBC_01306 TaxID=2903819 RepID=UPI00224E0ECE|nr:relaxase/mobilization nuclease domain-containing protein [Streptomyces sp. NBC_01306]MCX4725038.1 relaxase/mobilization nuclease domain-containing protein [Streptomyces sp. NBC_01306]